MKDQLARFQFTPFCKILAGTILPKGMQMSTQADIEWNFPLRDETDVSPVGKNRRSCKRRVALQTPTA